MQYVPASAGGFELYVDTFEKALLSGCGFRLIYERLAWFALELALQGYDCSGFYRTSNIGAIINIVIVLLLMGSLVTGYVAVELNIVIHLYVP